MKLKMLVGAAAAAALIATPAMAKSQEKSAGMQQQRSVDQTGAKKMKMSQHASHKTQARHAQLRESNASIQQQGSGFAPLRATEPRRTIHRSVVEAMPRRGDRRARDRTFGTCALPFRNPS